MSKSMGFRDSGKLDLSGKGAEYAVVGALLVIIIAALIFVVTQIWSCGGSTVGGGELRVRCTACNKEWEIDRKDASVFREEMIGMGGEPIAIDCDKCGAEKSVFLMKRCPKCGKYYLSKRIIDPDGYEKDGNRDLCPDCGTDPYKWHREHYKKR